MNSLYLILLLFFSYGISMSAMVRSVRPLNTKHLQARNYCNKSSDFRECGCGFRSNVFVFTPRCFEFIPDLNELDCSRRLLYAFWYLSKARRARQEGYSLIKGDLEEAKIAAGCKRNIAIVEGLLDNENFFSDWSILDRTRKNLEMKIDELLKKNKN